MIFGGVAAALGIAAAGYGLGFIIADRGNQLIAKELGSALRQTLPEGTKSEVISQLEAGDAKKAADLLSQGATLFEEMQCVPSGNSVLLEKGASVMNCETGMRALFAGFFQSNYPDYATFTIGQNRTTDYPGTPFLAEDGRYPGCSLIYEAAVPDVGPSQVKVAFDCPEKEEK
ncbi:hypothetical protein ACOTTU_11740 [Roseobacter sp. EG26]|uniref:hypothetical protein n=1 Tax=Roseobacter sp. EG26 TaxID=3412477 RepID=UPI003CE4BB12